MFRLVDPYLWLPMRVRRELVRQRLVVMMEVRTYMRERRRAVEFVAPVYGAWQA